MEVDIDSIDILNDIRYNISQLPKRSRFLFMGLLREQSKNCEELDEDYLNFLRNIIRESVSESEEGTDLDCNDSNDEDLNGNDHIINSDEKLENEDSDDDDPLYKLFLSHVKGDGKSFIFEMKDENGNLKTIEYHKKQPIDGWHIPEMKRNMNNDVKNERKRSRIEHKKSKNVKRSRLGSLSREKSNIPSRKKSKNVKRSCLGSLSRKESNIPNRKYTPRNQSVSHPQPMSNKDGVCKMGVEQLEMPLNEGRKTIKIEQESLIEEDYHRFLSSAKIVANRINLSLESDKSIVYDGQVDFGDVLCPDVKSVRHRSSGENNVEEEDSCQILGSSLGTDQLKEKVMANLRKPFDVKEYNTLWNVITQKRNISRFVQLRFGRDKSVSTDIKGKSYLEQYEAFRREIEAVPEDKYKRLNLLRGFFFWLQHVAWGSTFKPWEDEACLAVMPGSR